jgi:pyroglutamyl-peptidase
VSLKKVLLTGFEPFGGETVNPAGEVVKLLNGTMIDNVTIVVQKVDHKAGAGD